MKYLFQIIKHIFSGQHFAKINNIYNKVSEWLLLNIN